MYLMLCVSGLVLVGMCAQLQAMVILSPPDKKSVQSQMEMIRASLEQGDAGQKDTELNFLFDEVESFPDPQTFAEAIGLTSGAGVVTDTDSPRGQFHKSGRADFRDRDSVSDDDDSSQQGKSAKKTDKREDAAPSASTLLPRSAETYRDCGLNRQSHKPGEDALHLPAPQERTSARGRRSVRRQPTSALRVVTRASHSRRRMQRRRSRDSYRKRARILRRKRGKVVRAMVELLVVVENSIYRKFLAKSQNSRQVALARIRRYYGIVVAMMDQRFQTIEDPRLSISVRMSGIVVAETREDSSWMEALADWSRTAENNGRASVNTDKALFDFSRWIKAHFSTLPKFDHAMVFCGYRLTNKYDISFGGKAYLNAICDVKTGNSVSIVSDKSDYQCVKVATHELAHSLGSVHDGDPGFENCPADGNYIMAPVASYAKEKLKFAFRFSRCSIKQMKKLLRSKKMACVRDTPVVYYKYDLQRMPPGKMISPDQLCQMIYGPQSTFCSEYLVQVGICGQLWCRDPVNGACHTNSYLKALPGTPCKRGMSCHLGQCLADSVIKEMIYRTNARHAMSTDTSPTSGSRGVAPSRTSYRVPNQGDLDNTIPTVPQSVIRGRVGRPNRVSRVHHDRQQQHKARSGRRRSRPRNKSRRKGRCKANQPDQNVDYCRGLVSVNPGACKRRAIHNYCCRTCAFRR